MTYVIIKVLDEKGAINYLKPYQNILIKYYDSRLEKLMEPSDMSLEYVGHGLYEATFSPALSSTIIHVIIIDERGITVHSYAYVE